MDVTQIYAVTAGAIFGLIDQSRVLFRPISSTLQRIARKAFPLPQRSTSAPLLWTMHSSSSIVAPSLPGRQSIFCSIIEVSSIRELGTRTGTLSLINMMPSYFGYHLSFASDMLVLSIINYRRIHASTGALSVLLGLTLSSM